MILIDRNKLKKALPKKTSYDRYGKGFNDCLDRVNDIIDEQPIIDVHQAGNDCDTCEHETDNSGYCTECYYGGKWQRKGGAE